jgi:hypothetical protein
MTDAADTPLAALLESLDRLAAAQRAAVDALLDEDGPAADAVWASVETAFERWRAAGRQAAAGAESAPGAETLGRMLDPGQWLLTGCEGLDPTLRDLIAGPAPAALADFGRAALAETREWRALIRARRAHRRLIAAAWREAFDALTRDLAARPETDPIAVHRRWSTEAERALSALHRSDGFADSQARLVTAAVALREREVALVEAFCAARGLPTRREVDDLHRAVADLRREIRALREGR